MRRLRRIIVSWAIALAFCSPVQAQQQTVSCALDNSHTKTACEITPAASTSIEAGHVIKSGAGVLASATINNWGTSGGVTVFALDATAIPSNGTLPGCNYASGEYSSPCILKAFGLAQATSANQPTTLTLNYQPGPFPHYQSGLVFVCSSTGSFSFTATSECTFSVEAQ
jgi:hypothetical protein